MQRESATSTNAAIDVLWAFQRGKRSQESYQQLAESMYLKINEHLMDLKDLKSTDKLLGKAD